MASLIRTTGAVVLLALAYFATGKLGLMLAYAKGSVTPVWLPGGIALAAVLLIGYRLWPGVFLGAFLVNITAGSAVGTALGIATGNTLEALAAAFLLNRFAEGRRAFDRSQNVFKVLVLAGLVAPALGATIGVTSLVLGGHAARADSIPIWMAWWLGDASGALLVTPALVLWAVHPRLDWTGHKALEAMLLVAAAVAVGQAVFGGWLLPDVKLYPLVYLCLPVLAWSAFRFGPRETATVSLLLAGISVWGTLDGHGPFAGPTRQESLLPLQAFMILTSVIALALAAVVGERRRASGMRAQLAAIVESSDDAIIGKTLGGEIVTWNAAAERIFGHAAEDMIGQAGLDLLPPDRLGEEMEIVQRLKRGERVIHFETQRRRKDGTLIDVSLTLSPIRSGAGTIIGTSTILRDISDRKQTEKELARANRELAARVGALEHQSHQIMLLSQLAEMLQSSHTLEEIYTIINSFAPQLFRRESGFLGVMGNPANFIETVVTWGAPRAGKTDFRLDECWALRQAQLYGVGPSQARPFCQHLERPFPVACLCVPIMAESETLGVLHIQQTRAVDAAGDSLLNSSTQQMASAMAQQIALAIANLKMRVMLRSQAMRDPLTGLFNRRYLTDLLELELRRAQRTNTTVGLVMLDIDHFKRINDTYGHPAGDMVLRAFGNLLKAKCRGGDIVSRYGGEEFVVVMPAASLQDATRRAETLREGTGLLQLTYESQALGPITVSLGVAVFPDHGTTGEALIQTADAALYKAKQQGRNQVVAA